MTTTPNHTSVERLGDYLDGTLADARARGDVAAHLAACPTCAARLAALERLHAAAAAAPRAVEPPDDFWPSIRAAIGERAPRSAPGGGTAIGGRHRWRAVGALAAAALLVAALSSVATWQLVLRSRERTVAAATTRPPIASPTAREDSVGRAALLRYVVLERDYDRSAAELRAALDAQRGTLAPATVATVERSLRTIDAAIAEARAALARDPANQALLEMLTATHEQRLDLLRRATHIQSGA
jgi:hypothetical protein